MSQKTRYQAKFQGHKKKPGEGWIDFADDLQAIVVDKAYLSLQPEARQRLAVKSYLQQLLYPQVAFGIKRTYLESLDTAVTRTLKMESYTVSSVDTSAVSTLGHEVKQGTTATLDVMKLTCMVDQFSL